MLPCSARMREQFASVGFVVVPNALSSELTSSYRTALQNAVEARKKHFLGMPGFLDALGDAADNTNAAKHKAQRRFVRRRMVPKIKAKPGESLWEMSMRIASKLAQDTAQPTFKNDPQLRIAINKCRVNAWMSNTDVESLIRGEVGHVVGDIVRSCTPMSTPVLFADKPLLRGAFCRPMLLHFGAPMIGIAPAEVSQFSACVAWVFLDVPSVLRCPVRLMAGSHALVGPRWARADPQKFDLSFTPVDSHVNKWIKAMSLPFGTVETISTVSPGTVVLLHPHTLMALGPNMTLDPFMSTQLLVADQSAQASRQVASWVRLWRRSASQISFKNSTVFPPL